MMPVLVFGTLLYQTLLHALHVPVSFQDVLIHLTATDNHGFTAAYLFFLAVILAPLAEEVEAVPPPAGLWRATARRATGTAGPDRDRSSG